MIEKDGYRDVVRVRVETDAPATVTSGHVVAALTKHVSVLADEVHGSSLLVVPVVEILSPGTLHRESPIKVRWVVDRRDP